MSSTTQSKNTQDKRVISLAENIGSKIEYEVSSSDKLNDFKTEEKSNEGTKENTKNTENTAVPTKPLNFYDNSDLKPTEIKMDPDSTSRNPLGESVPSNNDSNRKSAKTPVNVQDDMNNKNNSKLRARASKKSASPPRLLECDWCKQSKTILEYTLPTLSGEIRQFCSDECVVQFRNVSKKSGSCKQCGNVIQSTVAPNKEYCSFHCMNKAMPKNGKILK